MTSKKTTVEQKWHGNEVKVQARLMTGKTAYEIGLVVEAYAKLLCPKRYGYLAASITTQAIDKGTSPELSVNYRQPGLNPKGGKYYSPAEMKISPPDSPNEVLVGTPLEYAPHVEFGTVKMQAQSFLRPALALARGKALTIVRVNGKYYFKEYLK